MSGSIVMYQGGNTASRSNNEEPPTKRPHGSDGGDCDGCQRCTSSYEEAINGDGKDEWLEAIANGFAAHQSNKAWTVDKRMAWIKMIDTKWVWARKWKRVSLSYKARLVALSFLLLFSVERTPPLPP